MYQDACGVQRDEYQRNHYAQAAQHVVQLVVPQLVAQYGFCFFGTQQRGKRVKKYNALVLPEACKICIAVAAPL